MKEPVYAEELYIALNEFVRTADYPTFRKRVADGWQELALLIKEFYGASKVLIHKVLESEPEPTPEERSFAELYKAREQLKTARLEAVQMLEELLKHPQKGESLRELVKVREDRKKVSQRLWKRWWESWDRQVLLQRALDLLTNHPSPKVRKAIQQACGASDFGALKAIVDKHWQEGKS